jgi:hypothetical protein
MRVRILALVFLGLLLTAPFTQMACAASVESGAGESSDYSADEGNDGKVTEAVFNSIKAAAEARRDEVFSKMSEDLPPSVLSDINEALNLMEEAEGSEATDMGGATQLYMQAMKLFRDSWRYIDDDAMPTGNTGGGEPLLVDEQDENLNEEILIAKQQLLLRFQVNFQSRIDTMHSHIQDLSGVMDPEDSNKAENALVSAEEKLLEVQKNMTDGNLEDALIKLDDTSKGLEDGFKSLKDKEAADLIVTVDKLEGKVQKLTEENTRPSGKNGSDAPEGTSDDPKASDEPKVTEEPKPTDDPKPKEEPKVTEEPKGNSGTSEGSSSESKGNSNSQKDSSKSTEDNINDLKEKIQKSLEDFKEKKSQQTSDNNGNSAKNDNGNGNSNSNEKSSANSAKNSNSYGNSNGNSAKNDNSNGNGNGNSKENQGKSKNN